MAEGFGSDEDTTSGDSAATKQKHPKTKIQKSSIKKTKPMSVKSSKTKPVNSSKTKPVNSSKTKPVNSSKPESVNSSQTKPVNSSKPESVNSSKTKPVKSSEHKAQLSRLAEKDPEFYEFLKEEDKSLLDFSDGDDEESDDNDDDDSSENSVDEEEDDEDKDDEEDEILKKLENFESDSDDDDDDDDGDADEKGGRFHKLPAKLEVGYPLYSWVKARQRGVKEIASRLTRDVIPGSSLSQLGSLLPELSPPLYLKLAKKNGLLSGLEKCIFADQEVDSDDEDDVDDESEDKDSLRRSRGTKVTKKMVNHWRGALQTNPTPAVLRKVIMVFRSAVTKSGSKDGKDVKYRVDGHAVFNSIVHVCLTELVPTLHTILGLKASVDTLQKPVATSCGKKWKIVRLDVKNYLTDLLKLVSQMSEVGVLTVLLKHIHRVVPYYACFSKLTKVIMKRLILLWSEGEETVRVMAFLCINRLVRMQQDAMLDSTLKQMYLAYVKNTKFTSPSTLPLINFTQRSLVEIFIIDMSIAYQHAFIYIRQLAIHLRNAITVNKKETCQAVYNWQYIHCLELWVKLLCATYPSDIMNALIYPLTQTIVGTIKLVSTARYYPLRFHCVRMMTSLSAATDTFIPVLPFLLEVFEQTNFNKKHKSLSFKPFNFACILKLSKSQLREKAFKDGLIDQVYELLLENLNVYSHCISFPELALPTLVQLKSFLKSCKVANYCRQIKQILEKVEETCATITKRRKTATFTLSDDKAVAAWERQSKDEGNPLNTYYCSWRKLRDRELQHEIAGKERISDMEIPTIERREQPKKASAQERKELSVLFNSDEDDDDSDDDRTRFLPKGERKAKRKAAGKEKPDSDDDSEYSDLDSDELEQLNQSADENDDTDDDKDIKEEEEEDDDGDDDDDVNKADVVKDFSWSDDED